jgi:hypothetical protein
MENTSPVPAGKSQSARRLPTLVFIQLSKIQRTIARVTSEYFE